MKLKSRVQEQQKRQEQQQQQQASAGVRAGLQQLSLSGSDTGGTSGSMDVNALAGAGLPNAGLAAEGNTESVAVSGAMGRSDMPMFDPGEMQDRIAELRDQMARQGGAGGAQIMN